MSNIFPMNLLAKATPGAKSAPPATAPAQAAQPQPQTQPQLAAAAPVDVEAVLTERAAHNAQQLDWRHSIVDLLKLLNLDSSLNARKELAHELHFTGNTNDSAEMNIWLIKEVMRKLAENGGRVPADLMA